MNSSGQPSTKPPLLLKQDLKENTLMIQSALGASTDFIIREMTCWNGYRLCLLYIEGLVDLQLVHTTIVNGLLNASPRKPEAYSYKEEALLHYLKEEVIAANDISLLEDMDTALTQLLSGNVILLLDQTSKGLCIGAAGWEERNVSEPSTQTVIRGPMESFTENIRTNTAMIRRKIKTPDLWLETRMIGTKTKTNVAVMYLNGVADKNILQELRRRLDNIAIDSILEGGYIEEFVQDSARSPFPTVYNSERPDTIAAGLLEGRFAVLVDGTPFVLLVPALFNHFLQSAEDYYQRADFSTLIRLLRYMALFITMLVPSLYIAITTFHQEMIPTRLLIDLTKQREGIPFPAYLEALLMEITYEILREAGVRMPRNVGPAVSFVGTLVIGQAAVEAGIVSAVMVIVVSITAISSFVIPSSGMSISIRMIRFIFMMLAASFGLFGILIGIFPLILHLCGLRSFGVPYMRPFGPFVMEDHKDTLFRFPWSRMSKHTLHPADDRQSPPNPK